MRVRLQKILAGAGVASRRHAETLLADGRVTVNGRTARVGDSADPEADEVRLDGKLVGAERPAYWVVHKPAGVLTTAHDPEGRRTVVGLLPPGLPRLFPVGRLDADTEGLVLLTNDGDVAQALLHPSFGNEREYAVRARGALSRDEAARLAAGVQLEDGRTAPARVSRVRFDRHHEETTLHLTLREGRKRQIRRALAALGHRVVRLVRVRFGPIALGDLPPGAARPLSASEVRVLRAHARRLRGAAAGAQAVRSSSPEPRARGRERSGPPRRRDAPRMRSD